MKCEKCGYEQESAFEICPECSKIIPDQEVSVVEIPSIDINGNPSVDKLRAALKNPLFLVLCILFTVSCGLSIIGGGFSVIHILLAIFFWIIFAETKKGLINIKNLKTVSGIVYAQYAINNVAAIILMVCGAIVSVSMALVMFVPNLSGLLSQITDELDKIFVDLSIKFTGALGIVLGLLVILSGFVWLVLNNLSTKKIHRFTKSIYKCALDGDAQFSKPNAAKNWLIVFGVCMVLYAIATIVGNVFLGVSLLFEAASTIIAAIMIDKYFMPQSQYV